MIPLDERERLAHIAGQLDGIALLLPHLRREEINIATVVKANRQAAEAIMATLAADLERRRDEETP